MSDKAHILDSSAVLALIEDKEGAERVEEVLREGRVLLPFVVLLEVYYITRRERGEPEANRRYGLLKRLVPEVLWGMDEGLLLRAGQLKAEYPISLADALIATFAIQEGAVLLHKDPEYEVLAQEVELEALPYRPGAAG